MARIADKKYPDKVLGTKVKAQFICGEFQKSRLDDLEDAIKQVNKLRDSSGQIVLRNNMRTLLEYLEEGEVIFVMRTPVRAARKSKPTEVITTIRTFSKGVDILWVVHHVEGASYGWKATYTPVGGAFNEFFLYSCDKLVNFS